MVRFLLNSAVITSPGTYVYRLVSAEEAAKWVQTNKYISHIGYQTTADHIERLSGIRPRLSREALPMFPGDEALVVRLKYRVQNPGQKGAIQPEPDDWEYGILTRTD